MEPIFILSLLSGLASHWLYFNHGEHHLNAPFLACFHVLLSIITIVAEICLHGGNYTIAIARSAFIFTCYLGSLFSSILMYRTCFHRLRFFPGPFLAGASKLWHSWKVRDSTNHILMGQLYEKYGTFVRTGRESPRSLWICFLRLIAISRPGRGNYIFSRSFIRYRLSWKPMYKT